MDTGYQMEPERVGRTRSRRLPALVGAIAIVLVVVIAKPWAGADTTPTGPPQNRAALVAPSPASAHATSVSTPIADPGWPVPDSSSTGATFASTQAEGALSLLDGRRGTWGIGDTGVGPRLIREEPWSDWTPVEPEVLQGAGQDGLPRHVLMWPGTGLCAGLATIYDRPTVVAVTTPVDVRPGSSVGDGWTGWWSVGSRAASIDASVRTVPTGDRSGITAIERTDGAPWPIGRYEFQLRVGDRTFDLTVCLTRGR